MRRFSSLGSFGAAVLVLGASGSVACGSSNTGPGYGGGSGSTGASGNSNGGSGSAGGGGGSGTQGGSGGGNQSGNGTSGGQGGGSGGAGSGATSGSGGSTGSGASGGSSGSAGSSASSGSSASGSSGSGSSGGSLDGGAKTGGDAGPLTRDCPPASPDVLADFEEDKGVMVRQGTPVRDGNFYTYNDMAAGGMQTPANANGIAVAPAPMDDPATPPATCNAYALHSTATGYTMYVGVGSPLLAAKTVYDLSAYDGIQFKIKAGSGGTQPVFFEVITAESAPPTTVSGGWAGGTASVPSGDEFNHRGKLLTNITSTWQTVYVPFALLISHWLPAPGATGGCGTGLCQAPIFNPAHALGLTFSVYLPKLLATSGAYDFWVDDITLYKDPTGAHDAPASLPNGITPTFKDATLGSCTKPAGASGKLLENAYANWYARFVTPSGSGLRVHRPENKDDSVSEGIAYGMLIAVYMNDPKLFAGLWNYWQQNQVAGNLMTWDIPGGQGSATDADQDAAFALLMAGKKWSSSAYTAAGTTMVGNVWAHDIDPASHLPTGGSNYNNSTSGQVTNASYFAPAYYPTFASVDPGHPWGAVTTAVYGSLNSLAGSNGLVPAWCTNNCTGVGSNGAMTDGIYQYDAHRVPWRIGLDYCLNGTASAKTYLSKVSAFFAGIGGPTGANGGGIGRLVDQYTLGGAPAANAAPNSMSLVGSAAVGAMSGSYASFVDSAWQFVLDGENRATLDVIPGAQSGYSYYNATVGLLTLLTMSGNFTTNP